MEDGPASEQVATTVASLTICIGASCAPDLAVVDALARLHLAVKRAGGGVRVRDASAALAELLELAGLADLLDQSVRTSGRSNASNSSG